MKSIPLAAVLALATIVLAAPVSAQTLSDGFRAGNEAYARGEYTEAATAYERLVESGVDDPDVYFDLGLSYAHLNRHGRAVAAFERALSLRPGDAGIVAALDASRGVLGRRRAEREGEAIVDAGPSLGETLFGWAAEDTLAVLVLLFDGAFFSLILGLFFARRESSRVALGIGAPLAGLFGLALSFGLASRSGALDPGPAAIVVREGAVVREAPAPTAEERHRALEGERVFVVGDEGEFSRVALSGGREGWMATSDLVEL